MKTGHGHFRSCCHILKRGVFFVVTFYKGYIENNLTQSLGGTLGQIGFDAKGVGGETTPGPPPLVRERDAVRGNPGAAAPLVSNTKRDAVGFYS